MTNIAFHGLGNMGHAMAGHLVLAGNAVRVHDRDPARQAAWQRQYQAPPPAEPPEVIITSVTDAAALRALAQENAGFAAQISTGVLWIDHTTTDPATARLCAALAAEYDTGFVDAPMSGGKAGAESGHLAFFAGGTVVNVERARAVTRPYCAHFAHLGPVGAGQAAKLAHQLAIAGTVLGLEAARAYGREHGLAPADLLAALEYGTARSAQLLQHREKMSIAEFDFADSFSWLAQDLTALSSESAPLAALLRRLLSMPAAAAAPP
jgi:3-hydroxyisobutyrate dehydrogenase-like beta-hydroxyacid dehydrogenase